VRATAPPGGNSDHGSTNCIATSTDLTAENAFFAIEDEWDAVHYYRQPALLLLFGARRTGDH
jgi:hypothetical protein